MEKPAKEAAAAPVSLYWDIKRFPVPEGYDARRVGPSIKRNLRKLGYSGPVTIIAIGVLTEVPLDILESLYSTGITFKNVGCTPRDAMSLFIVKNGTVPAPDNMMFLSAPPNCFQPFYYTDVEKLRKKGHYTSLLFARNSQEQKCLWEDNLLLADPGVLEGAKCGETGKPSFWDCDVCHGLRGYGFENFLTHLSTQQHKQLFSRWNTYATFDSHSKSHSKSDSGVEAPKSIVRRTILSKSRGLFSRTMLQLGLTTESNHKKSRLTTESNYKKTTESNYKKSRLTTESNYKQTTESNYKKGRLTTESNYKKRRVALGLLPKVTNDKEE
ncbi:PREDICTED: uncharacterized protein LOC104754827 [Camelina sativa]|uniref:Uncharacterized protein LOC104754815 n=1 Tax=Camelina sativa TaxID=90675 RepID=A0ABM0WS76_CAMSA|nr:PREDICTED: uncharacterized protein LOC104754815 [Camelina sativa]XP_010475411.1 PREDICTED: uncharacterized protein LOC104754827 [Camelina sativa]